MVFFLQPSEFLGVVRGVLFVFLSIIIVADERLNIRVILYYCSVETVCGTWFVVHALVGSPATRGGVRMPCLSSYSVDQAFPDGWSDFLLRERLPEGDLPFYFFFCFAKRRLRNCELIISTVVAAIALSCRLRFPRTAVTFVSQLRHSYSTKKKSSCHVLSLFPVLRI